APEDALPSQSGRPGSAGETAADAGPVSPTRPLPTTVWRPSPSPSGPAPSPGDAVARALARTKTVRRYHDAGDEESFVYRWRKPVAAVAAGGAILVLGSLGYRLFASYHLRGYSAHRKATLEGRPISKALIMFEPVWTKEPKFPLPRAVVQEDGTFALGTYGQDDGAPPGEYKVLIQWLLKRNDVLEVEGGSLPTNYLPARYGKFETSGLTVKIAEGE